MNPRCERLPKATAFSSRLPGKRKRSVAAIWGRSRTWTENGNIAVKLDDSGRTVAWNLNQNKHVDYAYAMTSHSSQGATVDRALIHIDTGDSRVRALIDETLAYVATSRPRYDAQVFHGRCRAVDGGALAQPSKHNGLVSGTNFCVFDCRVIAYELSKRFFLSYSRSLI